MGHVDAGFGDGGAVVTAPNRQTAAGTWLRRLAHLFFDPDTLESAVDPTLVDLAHEVSAARDDAERRAARFRGYVAFWKLVVLSPFIFGGWSERRQLVRSLINASAIVLLLLVIFGARSQWMARTLLEFYPRVEARLISIADVGVYAWLLAPIAVGCLAVFGRKSPFRVTPASVIMICGATVTAAAAYGGAGFVAVFAEVGRSGSAGLTGVISAMDALVIPTVLALGITALMSLALSVSQWRARHKSTVEAFPMAGLTRPGTVLLAASTILSLVVVNQWLLMNEDMIGVMFVLTNPRSSGQVGASVSQLAVPFIILGFVIAAAMLALSFVAWGRSRSRRPSQFLAWTTRLTTAATLGLCVWHGSVIAGQWQSFRAMAVAMTAR